MHAWWHQELAPHACYLEHHAVLMVHYPLTEAPLSALGVESIKDSRMGNFTVCIVSCRGAALLPMRGTVAFGLNRGFHTLPSSPQSWDCSRCRVQEVLGVQYVQSEVHKCWLDGGLLCVRSVPSCCLPLLVPPYPC